MMFSIDKKASLDHKNQKLKKKPKSLKIGGIGIFPKGLDHDFLFLEQKCQKYVFHDILEKKNVCPDN